MKKEKLVKKYFPVEPFDMAGLTEWLEQMAAQGLHLVKFKGTDRACFRPGPPDDTVRYGLDPRDVYAVDIDRNELYAEMGWEYVTTLNSLYYVYRCADPSVPALHTDPVVQADTITKLIRRRGWQLVIYLAYVAFILRGWLVPLFTAPWSLLELLLLKTAPVLLFAALVLFWLVPTVFYNLREIFVFRRLRKQLRLGFPLEDSRRFPRKFPRSVLDWASCLVVLLGLGAIVLLDVTAQRRLTGPEEWTFPHVTLEEALAGQAGGPITPDTPLEALHHDTFRASLLVPEQYDWAQRVSTERQTEYGVYIHFYRARSPEIASLLVRCLQEDERDLWSELRAETRFTGRSNIIELRDFEPIDHPGFDLLTYHVWYLKLSDLYVRLYVAQKGGQVITFTSDGIEDETRCLDILAGQL